MLRLEFLRVGEERKLRRVFRAALMPAPPSQTTHPEIKLSPSDNKQLLRRLGIVRSEQWHFRIFRSMHPPVCRAHGRAVPDTLGYANLDVAQNVYSDISRGDSVWMRSSRLSNLYHRADD